MYTKASKFFGKYYQQTTKEKLEISGITAVYNPVLVKNFIGSYRVAVSRYTGESRSLFTKR